MYLDNWGSIDEPDELPKLPVGVELSIANGQKYPHF